RRVRGHKMPADFAFKNVVFLAPACDFRQFGSLLDQKPALWERFYMFALQDVLESGYWEIPVLYPRSLLYLVSGAFEKELDEEKGAFDLPLLGMQRYHSLTGTYVEPEIRQLREYLKPGAGNRAIWSLADEVGFEIDSRKHGDFFRYANGQPTQV